MYAQLCKRLSEEAPNFEPPDQPCTFKLLLLNKCRTEFENRAQAFAAYDENDKTLSPEEEEKRHLAKCKMLGNIKFIGELGKLEILAESILHRCIQNLLARRTAAEHHEDLECLAQLVRTCGRVLDSERGRGLMDQYFERIERLSGSRELPPRIRFMLRDVAELRRGGWVPRAAVSAEGPVPIQQLRHDDEQPPPRRDRLAERDRDREPLFRSGLRSRPLDDVLAGLSLQPNLVPPPDKLFGNGFGGSREPFRHRSAPGYYPRGNQHYNKQSQNSHNAQGNGNKETAPRLSKSRLSGQAPLEDVQMRPSVNSLTYTANRLSKLQATPLPLAPVQQNVLAPTFTTATSLIKEPAITIKPAPDKKEKPKKDKGLNKEEVCRLVVEAAEAVSRECTEPAEGEEEPAALREHVQRLRDLQLPDKLLRRALAALLEHALPAPGDEGAPAAAAPGTLAWAACAVLRGIKRAPLAETLRALLHAKHPHRRLPDLIAHAIKQKLVTLSEVAGFCEGGQYYPLLLEVLQELKTQVGMERLQLLYNESKINLCTYVCEREGGDAAGALDALEARGLAALVPQLRVQAQLARQLAHEPAPQALFRWIKMNVEPSVRHNAAFVSTLVALVAGHVTAAAGSAGAADKGVLEREKALLEAYAPLLAKLLGGHPELQLAAVYAVQVHAHQHRYPKGMLLRWFMYLYNLEVCEEDAFLRWREDVTDAYPGKGEALFQVNTWLTWLQQQESEDEEAED